MRLSPLWLVVAALALVAAATSAKAGEDFACGALSAYALGAAIAGWKGVEQWARRRWPGYLPNRRDRLP